MCGAAQVYPYMVRVSYLPSTERTTNFCHTPTGFQVRFHVREDGNIGRYSLGQNERNPLQESQDWMQVCTCHEARMRAKYLCQGMHAFYLRNELQDDRLISTPIDAPFRVSAQLWSKSTEALGEGCDAPSVDQRGSNTIQHAFGVLGGI